MWPCRQRPPRKLPPTPRRGPRVTANLSIPGRYLVLLPGTSLKGVSRKIEDSKERQREVEEEAYSAIGALVGRIGAKVRQNWNKPPGSMAGLETVISVKVQRTGEVRSVKVVKSSGNVYFDQSAENAVYKASPLPFPDEPRYYEFIKEFNFKFVPDRN